MTSPGLIRRVAFSIVQACAGLMAAGTAGAQMLPIEWSLRMAPGKVRHGETATALVRAQIPYGWHLYSITQPPGGPLATEIDAVGLNFALRGAITMRDPDRKLDPVARIPTETFADSVTFRVPVTALKGGRQKLELRVRYQSCTDRFCTPPQTATVKANVLVEAAVPRRK